MENENILTFTIDTDEPVELDVFNKCLASLKKEFDSISQFSSELYVKEVRKGSLEIELLAVLKSAHEQIVPILTDVCAVALFFEYVVKTKEWLSGKTKKPEDTKYTIEQVRDFKEIFAPVAHSQNEHAEVRISIVDKPTLYVKKQEVMKITQYPEAEIGLSEVIDTPFIQTHLTKALFYWYQACFDDNKNTGNKGIISSVDKKPKKVIFQNDDSKAKFEMTTNHQQFGTDWQKVGYVVDVELMLRGSDIVAYKILENYLSDAIYE